MKFTAIVHPLSISLKDPGYDPSIHIAVEVLSSPLFKKKMIGIPVTTHHHDTMKAVELLKRQKKSLNAANMRFALQNLHTQQEGSFALAQRLLKDRKEVVTGRNLWRILPLVMGDSRGPGVIGQVTDFWESGGQWMVAITIDKQKISPLQLKLIKQGGALGEVSLTHAVIRGQIEPLEISLTIQGLRTGSAINRIVSASLIKGMTDDNTPPMDELDDLKSFCRRLPLDMQEGFLTHLKEVRDNVQISCNSMSKANELRLAELEQAMVLITDATATALNEMSETFGPIRSVGNSSPLVSAAETRMVLAAAATNMKKRKRDDVELDEALKEFTPNPNRVIAASRVKNVDKSSEDEFFTELRAMRQALKSLP